MELFTICIEVPLPAGRGLNGARGEMSILLGFPPSTTTE